MSLLSVDGWTWGPPGASPLWQDVRWALEPGQRQLLIGPSGCGKSSFLRCLVGLEQPRAGCLRWRGELISGHGFLALRRQVVYLPQHPVAVAGSLADELAFVRAIRPQTTLAQQMALLELLGLQSLPQTRRFDALSGGEQQRVCLARALSLEPQVLLLDEATASLDSLSEQAVERAVSSFLAAAPSRAVVWVSHRPEQIARLDASCVDVSLWRPV
jgi:ABC-type iron transport system FetAB ATPase subunit